jgi:predicted small integral membrane protein
LPIITNAFDRIFIGTVIFVAIHLLWMRFIEAYIPLFVATILSVLIGAAIVARG